MKKTRHLLIIGVAVLSFSLTASAHSGRTDSNGGHKDNKNVSGLGSYHYHHGYPAHLHTNGCPYEGGADTEAEVEIPPAPPKPSVSISSAPSEMKVGDASALEYTIENASDSASTVTSSDSNVVRVNEDKSLTAVAAGTATITIAGSGATDAFTVVVSAVPVESVVVGNMPADLQLGATLKLEAVVAPANATDKALTWSSDNMAIVEMKPDGTITGKSAGTAKITCQSASGAKAEKQLKVYEVFPDKIEVDVTEISLECKQTKSVKVTVLPEKANNKEYTFQIKDKTIAKMNENSQVEALSDGKTELVITTANGITKSIPIEVYHNAVKSLKLDDSKIKYIFSAFGDNIIDKNSDLDLDVKIQPDNATFRDVEWRSSNSEVAEVENGKLVIKGTGDVTLTANTYDNVETSISFKVIDKTGIILGGICGVGVLGGAGFLFVKKKRGSGTPGEGYEDKKEKSDTI